MGHYTQQWLWPAVSIEDDANGADDAALDAVDLLASIIDGDRWLRNAAFSSISLGINLASHPLPSKLSTRVRNRELEVNTTVDTARLPRDETALRWLFFGVASRLLEEIAAKYSLSSPPLRTVEDRAGEPSAHTVPLLSSAADVGPELAALEDNELLVVVPLQMQDEDQQRAGTRLARHEQALSRALGPSLGGSASGPAYAWIFSLPDDVSHQNWDVSP